MAAPEQFPAVRNPWKQCAVSCVFLVGLGCGGDGAIRGGGLMGSDAGLVDGRDAATEDAKPDDTADAAADAAPGANSDAASGDDPDPAISADARKLLESLRYDAAPFPADPSNRVADSMAARLFGQRLFFDGSLSGRLIEPDNDGSPAALGKKGEAGKVSCAGCHVPQDHFVDTRSPHGQISLAAQWGRRRAPTLLDVGALPHYNWDGRHDSLWSQAIGVMENAVEFNSGRLFVAQQIFRLHKASYEALFGAMPKLDDAGRFPQLTPETVGCQPGAPATQPCRGKPGDKADYDGMTAESKDAVTTVVVNTAKAMAAYVRQLRCGPSRFDKWLAGETSALSRSEQRGAALFVGAGKCVSCHSGPNLTDGKFHNVGLRPATVAVAFTDTDDRGAGEGLALSLTDPLNTKGKFSDGDRQVLPSVVGADKEGAFRTPTLRCSGSQPSFMHTGQLRTLASVVVFFDRGGDQLGYPGSNELSALNLSEREQADLTAFLGALQGAGADSALLTDPAK